MLLLLLVTREELEGPEVEAVVGAHDDAVGGAAWIRGQYLVIQSN